MYLHIGDSSTLGDIGYILVMMEAYETFHNQTYLEEAKIAANRLASDRGADEFFMTYELPMEAMGMLGLVKVRLVFTYACL